MAYNTYPQTASGRVFTNPPLSADPGRYTFLNLPNAEPNLSLPGKTSNTVAKSFLLSESLSGTRYWSTSAQISEYNDNIGIGTNLPNEKLTVVGNISATGNIYGTIYSPVVPAAAGGNTQVQYNSGGQLAANAGFAYNPTLSALVVGSNNSINGIYSTIAGGESNTSNGQASFIGSGNLNEVDGATNGFIGAGANNYISGDYTFIGGGILNEIYNTYSSIVGGNSNINRGYATLIGGGVNNVINAGTFYNAIVGGQNNNLAHNNSFILGSSISSVSANYTYVENLDIKDQTVFNGSIAEAYSNITPVTNVVSINLLSGTTFNLTLTENVSSFNITNIIENKVNSFALFVQQNATGGKAVNWSFTGRTLKWSNVPTVTQAASAVDFYTFITNNGGSTWYGFVSDQNLI